MIKRMNLNEILNEYGDNTPFYISYVGELGCLGQIIEFKSTFTGIKPKKVFVKKDLTVWDDETGACIINGMKDIVFTCSYDKSDLKIMMNDFIKIIESRIEFNKICMKTYNGTGDKELFKKFKSNEKILNILKSSNPRLLYKKL
jgi:hypothetical protein